MCSLLKAGLCVGSSQMFCISRSYAPSMPDISLARRDCDAKFWKCCGGATKWVHFSAIFLRLQSVQAWTQLYLVTTGVPSSFFTSIRRIAVDAPSGDMEEVMTSSAPERE